jgi:hypothetical protein
MIQEEEETRLGVFAWRQSRALLLISSQRTHTNGPS